jgi:hypothetical protein
MQEYGIHKVHVRMLPEETEINEHLEADDRQAQFMNLGLGLKRA